MNADPGNKSGDATSDTGDATSDTGDASGDTNVQPEWPDTPESPHDVGADVERTTNPAAGISEIPIVTDAKIIRINVDEAVSLERDFLVLRLTTETLVCEQPIALAELSPGETVIGLGHARLLELIRQLEVAASALAERSTDHPS